MGKSVISFTDSTNTVVKNVTNVTAYDFGTIYNTGFKSLIFGMSVRDFSEEIKYESEGFQLPLTFRMGLSMDLMDFKSDEHEMHTLLMSIDAVHPRSYPEYLNVGMEYTLIDMLSIRSGYLFNRDEQNVTVGVGFQKKMRDKFLSMDYAIVPFGILGDVSTFSIQLSL